MNVLFHNFLLTVTATLRVSLVTARSGPIVKLSLNQHQSILWSRVLQYNLSPRKGHFIQCPSRIIYHRETESGTVKFLSLLTYVAVVRVTYDMLFVSMGELTSANQGPGLSGLGPMRGRESGRGPGPGKIC